MKLKRFIAMLLTVITVLNIVQPYSFLAITESVMNASDAGSTPKTEAPGETGGETDEDYVKDMVFIDCESAVGNRVTLRPGETPFVFATLDTSIEASATYRWQLKISEDRWAFIDGYVSPYAFLTAALVASATQEGGSAFLRCIVTSNGQKYASEAMELVLAEDAPLMAFAASKVALLQDSVSEANTLAEDSSGAFQLVIDYKFRHASAAETTPIDGETVANTFTVTIPNGGYYSGTIASPSEIGYLPYVKAGDGDWEKDFVMGTPAESDYIEYDGQRYVPAHSIEFYKISEATHITVYYIPQMVDYIVKYHEQKLYSDEYVVASTEIRSARANEAVGAGLNQKRRGFYANPYEVTESISEDGSYVLDIYYDRLYYLVDFNTEDNNHYVRYNTQIMLPSPYLKGYAFESWRLHAVTDEDGADVSSHGYAASESAGALITVQYNLSYTATWQAATTSYTVVYWLENADEADTYDVWYTHKMSGTTGDKTIAGADNISQYITSDNGYTSGEVNDVAATYPYLIYNGDRTDKEQKVLKGDGTTTVNIYYARKEYTLKFYYAIEKTSGASSTYHVIGGSTYYFGGNAATSARADAKAAMRQYASGSYVNQTGQVVALPTLNEKGAARTAYSVSFDTDNNNKYHYISFSAKYGADITELWPCDVFNPVERTSKNTHGQWSGSKAFVSAWNGEYRVRYTQDPSVNNGNQTIKGKYTQLDANLLWNNPASVSETTVSYACFWENGANINWSVPELYRYKIYLPLLPNQEVPEEKKRTYNGVTYYLADEYDTCDDSSTSAQTQPGLVGFTSNGREWRAISEYDTSLYREAYEMYFYYSRNIYYLSFNDQHGNIVRLSVPYDTPLDDHEEADHVPAYPSDFEEGESVFEGWYYDEACTNRFSHSVTMPAKNIQLYANWQTLSYTVSVYFDTEKTIALHENQTALFGTLFAEPDYRAMQQLLEEYKNQLFIGWYYMDGAEEKRFDFNTMLIKKDMEIYARWTSEVLVDFLIRYVVMENGEYVDVAAPSEGTSLVGFTKTFVPLTAAELYPAYREGYFPEVRSHSITMSVNAAENTYLFVYSVSESMTYKVVHEFESNSFNQYIGAKTLTATLYYTLSGESIQDTAASVYVLFREGISKSVIIHAAEQQAGNPLNATQREELWKIVTSMSPSNFQQKLTLTTSQENVIHFEWEIHQDGAVPYQTVYYYQDSTGEYIPDDTIVMSSGTVGDAVNARLPANGEYDTNVYSLNTELSTLDGTLPGLFNADGTLSKGLILPVYFSRTAYQYTVRFYKHDTTQELAEAVTGTALYGAQLNVSDFAVHVDGYYLSNSDHSIVVGSNPEMNVLKCFYSGLGVYYRYQIIGAGAAFDFYADDNAEVGQQPQENTLTVATGHFVKPDSWYYEVDDTSASVPEAWLSQIDAKTFRVRPDEPPKEWAGKTVYIYVEILPETRRFAVTNAAVLADPQAFIFYLKGKEGTNTQSVDVTFVIVGNDYIDVCELPYGDYTISMLGWSWRYGKPTVQFRDQSIDFVTDSISISLTEVGDVIFNYPTAPNDQWLTDETAKYITLTPAN